MPVRLPLFKPFRRSKYERCYPIGNVTSRDPRMFTKYNMAVSVDEAIREALRLFPNVLSACSTLTSWLHCVD